MTFDRLMRAAAAVLAGLAFAGCSDGNTQPLAELVVIEDRNIQGVTVTASRDVIAIGEVLALAAAESTTGDDLTEELSWSSSDNAIASVTGNGQVTGVADGMVTITGSIGEFSDAVTLTVSSALLVSIEVSSDALPVDVCTSGQLTATGTYADGRSEDETANVTWQSADIAAADFDTTTAGQINTLAAGSVNVTASLDGVDSPAFAVEIADTLSGVSAALASTTIDAGATTTLTASGNYSGTLVDITSNATFVSGAVDVATVDAEGTVTGVSSGNAIITATCNALSGDATVTVSGTTTTRTLVDLDIEGTEPFDLRLGSTLQLEALAEYSDQTTENVTEETIWTIAIGSANTVTVSNIAGERGLVRPLTLGSSLVRAEFDGESVTVEVRVAQ